MLKSIEQSFTPTLGEQAAFDQKLLQATIKLKNLTLEDNFQAQSSSPSSPKAVGHFNNAVYPCKRGKDFDDLQSCGVKKIKSADEVEIEEVDGEEEEIFYDAMDIDWGEVRVMEVKEKMLKEEAKNAMEVDEVVEPLATVSHEMPMPAMQVSNAMFVDKDVEEEPVAIKKQCFGDIDERAAFEEEEEEVDREEGFVEDRAVEAEEEKQEEPEVDRNTKESGVESTGGQEGGHLAKDDRVDEEKIEERPVGEAEDAYAAFLKEGPQNAATAFAMLAEMASDEEEEEVDDAFIFE
ncbi:uncharacterized protein BYT42DRAFT_610692 [Radiomyces spectabilis]|uniref:uncharacterized protein n=1 Tax=Radiomyces spectabilis TaxID=64574 RepID=UPI00221F7693|nr:uncharacterized protein BYT42DRAFT_610692 [Radiomyces spectabilis]KAI8391466.1 hypothetical protein BYT42DRAFT_610692 [Radiomyces spectabilis]